MQQQPAWLTEEDPNNSVESPGKASRSSAGSGGRRPNSGSFRRNRRRGSQNQKAAPAAEPAWLGDDDAHDTSQDASQESTPQRKEHSRAQRAPKGGEVVAVDTSVGDQGPKSKAPPAAFMERMAQFEKNRQQRQARPGSGKRRNSTSKPSKPATTTPRQVQPPGLKCPTPPSFAGAQSPRSQRRVHRKQGNGNDAALGDNGGLSEASRTVAVDLDDFVTLTEDEKREYSDEVTAFGADTVARSRAPNFQLRIAATQAVGKSFDAIYTASPVPALEATLKYFARALRDSVTKALVAGCTALESVLKQVHFLPEEAWDGITAVITTLRDQLRDNRTKTYGVVLHALHTMCRHDAIGPVPVVDTLAQPPLNKLASTATHESSHSVTDVLTPEFHQHTQALGANWKVLEARVDAAYSIVREYANVVSGSEQGLMALGIAGLCCANSRVRRSAIVLVTELYRTLRARVEAYLPAVKAQATIRLLREEIDVEIVDDAGDVAAGPSDAQQQEQADLAAHEANMPDLTDAQRDQLAQWTSSIPVASLPCFFSGNWRLRQRVLERLLACEAIGLCAGEDDDTAPSVSTEGMATSLSEVVSCALTQHVPAVAATAATVADAVFKSSAWEQPHKYAFGAPLITPLLRFGANEKVPSAQETSLALLSQLTATNPASAPGAVASAASACGGPSVAKTAGKLLLPRLAALTQVLDDFGVNGSTVDVDEVLGFALDALRHQNGRVRRVAVDTVLAAYKAAGVVVQKRLEALDGSILDEVRERVAALSKKERSKTGPSRRLATLVGAGASLDEGGNASGVGASDGRPATIDASGADASPPRAAHEFAQARGTSLRQRMALWREAQNADPALADTPSPNVKPKKNQPQSASPNQSSSPSGRPPVPNSAPGRDAPAAAQALHVPSQQVRRGKLVFA